MADTKVRSFPRAAEPGPTIDGLVVFDTDGRPLARAAGCSLVGRNLRLEQITSGRETLLHHASSGSASVSVAAGEVVFRGVLVVRRSAASSVFDVRLR